MEKKQDKLTGAEVFKLAPADIDHVFRRSGLAGNSLADLQYNPEQAAVSQPSPWFSALAQHPRFPAVARQLLEPEVKIAFQTGGGAATEERYQIKLSTPDDGILAQYADREGNWLLINFPDRPSFLDWWTGTYSAAGMGDYPAIFAGIQETEVLICALHCVDLYRRFYMESMLDFRGLVDLSVSTADFVQLLKKSLASGDKRWLLPTAFGLTPGLRGSNIALKPEHLKRLEEAGFVTIQDSMLTLAERSRLMGTEFIGPWMSSAGGQATALIQGQEKILSRVFLASTAFANHLFSFETGPEGQSRFRHQALTGAELAGQMSKWLAALTQVGASPASGRPEPEEHTAPTRFCGQCGEEIRPGKKFCANCGTAL